MECFSFSLYQFVTNMHNMFIISHRYHLPWSEARKHLTSEGWACGVDRFWFVFLDKLQTTSMLAISFWFRFLFLWTHYVIIKLGLFYLIYTSFVNKSKTSFVTKFCQMRFLDIRKFTMVLKFRIEHASKLYRNDT